MSGQGEQRAVQTLCGTQVEHLVGRPDLDATSYHGRAKHTSAPMGERPGTTVAALSGTGHDTGQAVACHWPKNRHPGPDGQEARTGPPEEEVPL
jgi:hypothetical protein